jgi:hypothetical protein
MAIAMAFPVEAGVNVSAVVTSLLLNVTAPVRVLNEVTAPLALNAASSHAAPSQT